MIAAADGSGEPRGVPVAPVVGPFPAGQLLNPGVWLPDGSAYSAVSWCAPETATFGASRATGRRR